MYRPHPAIHRNLATTIEDADGRRTVYTRCRYIPFILFSHLVGLLFLVGTSVTRGAEEAEHGRFPDLYVVVPGMNDNGEKLEALANEVARPDSVDVTIQQVDSDANQSTKSIAEAYLEAKHLGTDVVVRIDMDLEGYDVGSEYMKSPEQNRWHAATEWAGEAIDRAVSTFEQLGGDGRTTLYAHSAGGDAAGQHIARAEGTKFDRIEIIMGRARARDVVLSAAIRGYKVDHQHVQTGVGHSSLINNPTKPVELEGKGKTETSTFLQHLRSDVGEKPVMTIITGKGDYPGVGSLSEKRAVRDSLAEVQRRVDHDWSQAEIQLGNITDAENVRILWKDQFFGLRLPEPLYGRTKSASRRDATVMIVDGMKIVEVYVNGYLVWVAIADSEDRVLRQGPPDMRSSGSDVQVLDDSAKRGTGNISNPPPPPPPGGEGVIGGVALSATAEISSLDVKNSGGTLAASPHGEFCLVLNTETGTVSELEYRRFITALWAVYFGSEDPGVSIDFISGDSDRQAVRLIGNVRSELGSIMLNCDYRMKLAAIGTNPLDVAGFQDVGDLSHTTGVRYLGARRRFWFVPQNFRFAKAGNAIVFESGRMTLKTEYAFRQGKSANAEPADEQFAKFWSENYDRIAERHPLYQDLFTYAKLCSLAKYLKSSGVVLHAFLLMRRHLIISAEIPGTVATLRTPSRVLKGAYLTGGVDLGVDMSAGVKGRYVLEESLGRELSSAIKSLETASFDDLSHRSVGNGSITQPRVRVQRRGRPMTLVSARSVGGLARSDVAVHTDLAIRAGSEPGPELSRYLLSGSQLTGAFGKGWDLFIPYRVTSVGTERTRCANVLVPVRMQVIDLIDGSRETLIYDEKRFGVAAWVPVYPELSRFVGLAILSDASFRLFEKIGAQFGFDSQGALTEIWFSDTSSVYFEYERGRIVALRDPQNVRIELEYDGTGKIVEAKSAVGSTEYHYLGNRLTRVSGPNGRETYLLYKPDGVLTDVLARP